MRELTLNFSRGPSRFIIGSKLPELSSVFGSKHLFALADQRLKDLRPEWKIPCQVEWIEGGESIKSFHYLEKILERMLRCGLDRHSTILAVGGGALCDLAGLVAAIYMRGIEYCSIPTTLLAQADACLGGKNGINFGGIKNLVGTLHHPRTCVCDLNWLATLSPAQYRQGLAELVKHALIADAQFLHFIEDHVGEILARDLSVLEHLVFTSLSIKARFVKADEMDFGARHALNFGHTMGHALESHYNLPHGDAVALGMLLEIKLSQHLGVLESDPFERVRALLQRFSFPTQMQISWPQLKTYLAHDKKSSADKLNLPLIQEIGRFELCDVERDSLTHNAVW